MTDYKLPVCLCKRCGYTWSPRTNDKPLRCPKCGTAYWNRDRVRNIKEVK